MHDATRRMLNHLENFFSRRFSVRRNRGRRVSTEVLEQRQMLSANFQLVKDIDTKVASRSPSPHEFVAVGSTTFFVASTNSSVGLWRTDGTAAGTRLVKGPREGGFTEMSGLTELNGTLYFWANGGYNLTGIWKSDGTSVGTVFVKEIAGASNFTILGSTLYFAGTDDYYGTELWKSDGTTAGTRMVKNIHQGSHRGLLPYDSSTPIFQYGELPNSSFPTGLISIGGMLYFAATDSTAGRELWKSDGTAAGTVLVKDILSGFHQEYRTEYEQQEARAIDVPNGSSPRQLINFRGALYFSAEGRLWRSDGTAAGTVLVKNVRSGGPGFLYEFVNVGGTLYFVAENLQNVQELWKSDGTATGTVLLKTIQRTVNGFSNSPDLINVGGTLYFTANEAASGIELWRTDGTVAGTRIVKDLHSGPLDSFPKQLVNVGGVLYFSADDGNSSRKLWQSNGTAAGTKLVSSIRSGNPFSPSNPTDLTNIDGTLYFVSNDEVAGQVFWISNGTSAGTVPIKLLQENDSSTPREFANANGILYFSANDGVHGTELWKSDGTSNGTVLVKDIRSGSNGSDPGNLTSVGPVVYFTANDGVNGTELWKSDGTSNGTVLVKNIRSGSNSSGPESLTNVGGILYFSAQLDNFDFELWKSDGTAAGTVVVKHIDYRYSGPQQLTSHGGMLYFTRDFHETELWKSDGTAAGTVLVKEVVYGVGPKVTGPHGFLFFLGRTGLWRSNGTPNGTGRIKDLEAEWRVGRKIINVAGTLYFTARVSTPRVPSGPEQLWKSDGTATGTVLVEDAFVGTRNPAFPKGVIPESLTNVDGTLYFVASSGSDTAIWKSDGTALGTVRVREARLGTSIHAVGDRLFASLNSEVYGDELYVSRPFGTAGDDVFALNYSQVGARYEVTVTRSTNGGPVSTLGTFPTEVPLFLDGLGGNDSVRVVGTSGDDTFSVNSRSGLIVNGASVILTSIETRTLSGAAGNDVYRFDADTALGVWALDEASGARDTVNFSPTTTVGLSLNLATAALQSVHATNLKLSLGSGLTIENAVGGSGADTLTGNSLGNRLTGGPGNDRLIGASGDDTYLFNPASVAEADQVLENPNEGTDTLSFASLTTSVAINLGTTSIQPVHANRTVKLNSAVAFENLIGGSGADTLFGNTLNNTVTGGAGDDKLVGAGGSDSLLGGAHNDTYIFVPATFAEADQVIENPDEGTDTLSFPYLTTGITVNLGLTSAQAVHLNRTVKLNSVMGFENVIGGSGADTLFGNRLNNTLTGGDGDDLLNGGPGSDVLLGGAGNDTYFFASSSTAEADQVTEKANEGVDTLNFAYLTTGVALNLGSTSIQAVHTNRALKLNSIGTFENAVGGSGSDMLLGNALANRLTGGSGHNILVGMEGSDILEAGSGRDILIGGLGADTLNGGAGDDILIAGRTTSDTNLANLNTLRAQWISSNSYATRITNLRAGVGSPVVSFKTKINVLNDAGEDDVLYGGAGTDWFFRALDDVINDLVTGELIDVL